LYDALVADVADGSLTASLASSCGCDVVVVYVTYVEFLRQFPTQFPTTLPQPEPTVAGALVKSDPNYASASAIGVALGTGLCLMLVLTVSLRQKNRKDAARKFRDDESVDVTNFANASDEGCDEESGKEMRPRTSNYEVPLNDTEEGGLGDGKAPVAHRSRSPSMDLAATSPVTSEKQLRLLIASRRGSPRRDLRLLRRSSSEALAGLGSRLGEEDDGTATSMDKTGFREKPSHSPVSLDRLRGPKVEPREELKDEREEEEEGEDREAHSPVSPPVPPPPSGTLPPRDRARYSATSSSSPPFFSTSSRLSLDVVEEFAQIRAPARPSEGDSAAQRQGGGAAAAPSSSQFSYKRLRQLSNNAAGPSKGSTAAEKAAAPTTAAIVPLVSKRKGEKASVTSSSLDLRRAYLLNRRKEKDTVASAPEDVPITEAEAAPPSRLQRRVEQSRATQSAAPDAAGDEPSTGDFLSVLLGSFRDGVL